MKKITSAVLLAAITMISFTACKSGGGKTADGYVLKMRLAKGDKFSQETNMNMDMSMTVMGHSQNMKMKMDVGTDFEVMDTASAGKNLKITYNKMDMTMDMGNPSVNSVTDSAMKKTGTAVVGKSVIITINGNKITDVKGMDAIIGANTTDTVAQKSVEKMFSKENFNSMFGMMFSMYPDHPVKEGDTWSAENTVDMSGMAMTVKTTYKLLAVKDGIAQLDVNGTIDTKGSMTQGGMSMQMDMKGTQTGKMNVKLEDGYLQSGNYDMDIDASMDVAGQKMPMKIKMAATLKGK